LRRNLTAHQAVLPGTQLPCSVVTLDAPGLTMEHIFAYYDNVEENQMAMSHNRLTLAHISEDSGAILRRVRMKLPRPLSPRSMIT
jgi:hypothetical protein